MKKVCAWTLGPFLALLLVLLNFGSTNSSIIPKNGAGINRRVPLVTVKNGPKKENITMDLFEEAVEDYVELSNAFYGPAASEAQRDKRASTVFQRIANRTRSGVKSLRNLFSGRRRNKSGSEDDDGGKTRSFSFGKFFSNLLNRILVFLTNLWERISGLFRRRTSGEDGEEGGTSESTGKKLINRIRTGASALAKRLRGSGGGGGGAGILASLTGLLGPKSTSEPYEVDYSDDSDKDSDSDSDSDSKGNLENEGSTDLPSSTSTTSTTESSDKTGNYISAGGYSDYNTNAARNPFADFDNSADASVHTGQFIPFPMDSDPNFHLNGAPVSNYYSVSPAQDSTNSRYYSYYT